MSNQEIPISIPYNFISIIRCVTSITLKASYRKSLNAMLSLFHWLSIQGLFNGVLISLLVLRKRPGKSIQRVFVGLFFALVSLGMALILVQNSGWFTGRLLQHLELSFGLLVGPLVWLYFKNEGHQTSSLDLLHLLWPLVYWITVVAGDLMDFRPFKPELLLMIHFQVYVLVSCLTWPGIFQSIRSWTTMVAGVCILLGITQWVRFTYAHIALFDLIIPTCLGCCFYLVLIKLILVTKTPEREITKSKYSTQDIVALDNFMRQNQPYLNPGLKLFHLAHQGHKTISTP